MRSAAFCSIVVVAVASLATACGSDEPAADPTASSTTAVTTDPVTTDPVTSDPVTSAPVGTEAVTTTADTLSPTTSASSSSTGATLVAGDDPVASPTSVYAAGDIDPDLAPFIGLAVDDLSSTMGIDPAAVTAHSAVTVVWADSSLGCAEKGMQYTQVQSDGALIELAVDSMLYRYHAGGSTEPFLCDQPLTTPPTRLD